VFNGWRSGWAKTTIVLLETTICTLFASCVSPWLADRLRSLFALGTIVDGLAFILVFSIVAILLSLLRLWHKQRKQHIFFPPAAPPLLSRWTGILIGMLIGSIRGLVLLFLIVVLFGRPSIAWQHSSVATCLRKSASIATSSLPRKIRRTYLYFIFDINSVQGQNNPGNLNEKLCVQAPQPS